MAKSVESNCRDLTKFEKEKERMTENLVTNEIITKSKEEQMAVKE